MNSDNSPFQGVRDPKEQQVKHALQKLEALALSFVNPFALKAVVDLGIPDIISRAGGVLTLNEIAEQLPTTTVQLEWLFRVMRFNVLNDVFTELTPSDVHLDMGERRFGLTLASSLLVQDNNPLCPVPMFDMTWSKTALQPWFRLSEAVLSGTDPCRLEYGKTFWEMAQEKPEWGEVFNKAMACASRMKLPAVVQGYKGFKDLKQLVDVGGGIGATLALITQSYPEIEAINFDLPRVVGKAPAIPGVKHVGGDMFVSVPQGEAILMKLILHDWSDDESVTILRNCHKSLPKDGKVILIENVLADVKDVAHHPELRKSYYSDMIMLAKTTTGKERTALEWHTILNDAGFKRVKITAYPTCPLHTVEGFKC